MQLWNVTIDHTRQSQQAHNWLGNHYSFVGRAKSKYINDEWGLQRVWNVSLQVNNYTVGSKKEENSAAVKLTASDQKRNERPRREVGKARE